ncbi:MAG: N-acetylmuramoyl-L-alanine amidase [Methylococcales bacterium]|nr:N-acetylmuramoyl-L-alanine amidase [Methylococcales bacterium]
MRRYWKLLIILLSLHCLISLAYAEDVLRVNSLRYWSTPDQSRITFDVTGSANQNKVQFFDNPARLVIDLPNAVAAKDLAQPSASHPLFSSIRVGIKNGTDLRMVIDLKKPLSAKTTTLHTDALGNNRFVVELLDKGLATQSIAKIEPKTIEPKTELKIEAKPIDKTALIQTNPVVEKISPKVTIVEKTSPVIDVKKTEKKSSVKNTEIAKNQTVKPFVVAIDAGHGGNDSGAQGSGGTYEKDVVFSIAKKLEALVNAQKGMQAVMVRQGDYYVGLRKRMDIARAAKADVFISIHADSIKDTAVRGASVYALSTSGASSESAYWRAHSENAADLVEGEQLNDEENGLTNVLLDLSQSATQEASVLLANKVLRNFESVAQLHFESVQKAGFAVLKSPEIPSILVETAFISNHEEEMKLVNSGHQLKIATAILKGVHGYMKQPKNEQQRIAAL